MHIKTKHLFPLLVSFVALILSACSRDNPLSDPAPFPDEDDTACVESIMDQDFINQPLVTNGADQYLLSLDENLVELPSLVDHLYLSYSLSDLSFFNEEGFELDQLSVFVAACEEGSGTCGLGSAACQADSDDCPTEGVVEQTLGAGDISEILNFVSGDNDVIVRLSGQVDKRRTNSRGEYIFDCPLTDEEASSETARTAQIAKLEARKTELEDGGLSSSSEIDEYNEIVADIASLEDEELKRSITYKRVYYYNMSRASSLQSSLVSPALGNSDADDEFGRAVAASSEYVVVGVPYDDSSLTGINPSSSVTALDNDLTDSGAAYVYKREDDGSLTELFYLKDDFAEAGDQFGYSVSVYDDTIAVSALFEDGLTENGDNLAEDSGKVFLYEISSETVGAITTYYMSLVDTFKGELEPRVDGYNDAFGQTILIRDSWLFVGAPKDDTKPGGAEGEFSANSGAVYAFFEESPGEWERRAVLKAPNAEAGDSFGSALSYYDDMLVIGAPGEDSSFQSVVLMGSDNESPLSDNASENSGAVYGFAPQGDTWANTNYVKASNADSGDNFGAALALGDRNELVVGAPREDSNGRGLNRSANDNSLPDSGAAYGYYLESSSGRWVEYVYMKAQEPEQGAVYGSSLAFDTNDLFVGAPLESNDEGGSTGMIYQYNTSMDDNSLSFVDLISLDDNFGNARFGRALGIFGSGLVVGANTASSEIAAAGNSRAGKVIYLQ